MRREHYVCVEDKLLILFRQTVERLNLAQVHAVYC